MQEKKTQNPSLPVTHETMHGNQEKRTQKSKEENHNVQGVPHTESKSSGPGHLPEHHKATGW